jgi:hypothetical protein
MEQTMTIPGCVADLGGLLADLRKNGFAVSNVGSDAKSTYIYLEEGEEKDPSPIVETWKGRVAPVLNVATLEKKKKEAAENPPKKSSWWNPLRFFRKKK